MVTTNCLELTGEGNCKEPLTGKTAQELQQNVFKHAQQHHFEKMKKMSPQEQAKMGERIHQVFHQKSKGPKAFMTGAVEDPVVNWPA